MVEAWMHGRPVIVHADCLATAAPVRESQAGWVASGIDGWSRIFETVDEADASSLTSIGDRGRAYAQEYGAWEKVIARYEVALAARPEPSAVSEWDISPDPALIAALQDGRTNLMWAGEFVDFEQLGELIEMFLHYLTLERHARLVLIGWHRIEPAVHRKLTQEVESLRLNDDVVVTTGLSPAQQLSVYQTSKLFCSMAGSGDFLEQFLLNAMWFDVPIMAYKGTATTKVAGDSSILFTSKSDLQEVAALAKILTSDAQLRAAIIAKQRERRTGFAAQKRTPV
jgi:hypothetical protein